MSRSGKHVDVSVIIPTYNRAGLVVEAIESVLRQTAPPREIIVVDDGSTDGTPDALASFGDRIVAVRQDNQGVGGARNRALAMATGRYLAFLDSDDTWLEFKLELQVAIMEQHPSLGFLFSDFLITGEGERITPQGLQTWFHNPLRWEEVLENMTVSSVERSPEKEPVRLYCGQIYRALLSEPYVLPTCAIVRSDRVTKDVRFAENDPMCSDWEFFARLARTCTAGFLDLDTAINRGGNDRARLTQTSNAVKAEQRLRMIHAVWKADTSFLARHADEVVGVEADQWLSLARARVVDSEPLAALMALKRWFGLGHFRRWRIALVLAGCALVPGSGAVLRVVRRLLEGKGSVVTAEPRITQTETRSG
jgi:glycosyltransferase involved in cell wall biosynthesis